MWVVCVFVLFLTLLGKPCHTNNQKINYLKRNTRAIYVVFHAQLGKGIYSRLGIGGPYCKYQLNLDNGTERGQCEWGIYFSINPN